MSIIRLTILLSINIVLAVCFRAGITFERQVFEILQDSVLLLAEEYVHEAPLTVTTDYCSRSTGGIHDFYSEGDYWWPDKNNIDGPYVRRDGMTNPDNFTVHREVLLRFSEIVGNLTSAYIISKDSVYANAAISHCDAWFISESSKMSPHLLYAQAIQGRHTGRGIGIIDGIHFMEVAQSLIVLKKYGLIDNKRMTEYRKWFSDFLIWLTTHEYGKDEMVHPNNHGTCWNMQVGLYSILAKNDSILSFCRENFRNNILPNQMAHDGSFPRELDRTKPYGYSLFNLDAMVMNCLVLSDKNNDLWNYTTEDGRTILLGLDYMKPYVEDKSKWDLEPDVMYWDNWPVAHPSFLFGAIVFNRPDYFGLWKENDHFLEIYEIKRNLPIRNPLIWLSTLKLKD